MKYGTGAMIWQSVIYFWVGVFTHEAYVDGGFWRAVLGLTVFFAIVVLASTAIMLVRSWLR